MPLWRRPLWLYGILSIHDIKSIVSSSLEYISLEQNLFSMALVHTKSMQHFLDQCRWLLIRNIDSSKGGLILFLDLVFVNVTIEKILSIVAFGAGTVRQVKA